MVSGRVPLSFYLRLLCNHFRGTEADETNLFIGVDSEDRCDPGSGVRGSCHGEYDGGVKMSGEGEAVSIRVIGCLSGLTWSRNCGYDLIQLEGE